MTSQFRIRKSDFNTIDLADLAGSLYIYMQDMIQTQINNSIVSGSDYYEVVNSNNSTGTFKYLVGTTTGSSIAGVYSPTGSTFVNSNGTSIVVSSTTDYFLPGINSITGAKKTITLQDTRAGPAYVVLGTSSTGSLGIITASGGQYGKLVLSATQPTANLTFNGNIWTPDSLTSMTVSNNLNKTYSGNFSRAGYDVDCNGYGNAFFSGNPGITGGMGTVYYQFISPTGSSLVGSITGPNNFGQSVSVNTNANLLVVGTPGITGVNNTGSINLYSLNNGGEYNQIFTSTGSIYYGYYTDISSYSNNGNNMIVGSSSNSSAYIYNISQSLNTSLIQTITSTGQFGYSVAIAGDGNTLAIGNPTDNSGTGSVSIYTVNNTGMYSLLQTVVGTDGIGTPAQGSSVALSGDGSTLAVGGPNDNGNIGSAWVFQKTNTVSGQPYTQQEKITGYGSSGTPINQGYDVRLSGDGNSLCIDAPQSSGGIGGVFLFTRPKNQTTWSQQSFITPNGTNIGDGQFGFSVALNSNGSGVFIGAPNDNTTSGAIYELF